MAIQTEHTMCCEINVLTKSVRYEVRDPGTLLTVNAMRLPFGMTQSR